MVRTAHDERGHRPRVRRDRRLPRARRREHLPGPRLPQRGTRAPLDRVRPPGAARRGRAPAEDAGIGDELSAKIREIHDTGTSRTLEKLRKDYPAGILDLLRLPGIGPKRVRLFYRELGVGSLEELEGAVRSGRLRSLGGFGPKSEQRLLEAIMTVKLAHARRI